MSAGLVRLQAIRRILVALDGSDESLAAVDAAVALAAHLGAELEALFVEDIDLLRLAELPCARVISLARLELEHTDRAHMERRLRLRAARAEGAVLRRAGTLGVHATFRSVRGEVAPEVLTAATTADLLSLGRAGPSPTGHNRLGSTLQAALASGRPLLVAGRRPHSGRGLLAAYDGAGSSQRALDLAAELASSVGQPLTVVIVAGTPAEAGQLAGEAHALLDSLGVHADMLYAWAEPAPALLASARRLRPALLVLGLSDREEAAHVLQDARCPLLLVP